MISYEDEKLERQHDELIDALTAIANRLSLLVSCAKIFLQANYRYSPRVSKEINEAIDNMNEALMAAECDEEDCEDCEQCRT